VLGLLLLVGVTVFLSMATKVDPQKPEPERGGTRADFVVQFKAAAALVDMRGIPIDLALAVAALETGWGTGRVFQRSKNLFSIKAGSSWGGSVLPVENAEGSVRFRAYGSWEDSIRDWVELITRVKRYATAWAFAQGGHFKEFYQALQAAGYAGGDTQYSAKLSNTLAIVKSVVV